MKGKVTLGVFCHNCAHENPSTYRFCLHCGRAREGTEKYMQPCEVAEMLQVSTSWVSKHCTTLRPLLPHYQCNGMRRFLRSEVIRFVEAARCNLQEKDATRGRPPRASRSRKEI